MPELIQDILDETQKELVRSRDASVEELAKELTELNNMKLEEINDE